MFLFVVVVERAFFCALAAAIFGRPHNDEDFIHFSRDESLKRRPWLHRGGGDSCYHFCLSYYSLRDWRRTCRSGHRDTREFFRPQFGPLNECSLGGTEQLSACARNVAWSWESFDSGQPKYCQSEIPAVVVAVAVVVVVGTGLLAEGARYRPRLDVLL